MQIIEEDAGRGDVTERQRASYLSLEPVDRDFRCPLCFGFVFGLPTECSTCTAFYCADHVMSTCGVCRQPLRRANAKLISIVKEAALTCAVCDRTLRAREAPIHFTTCFGDVTHRETELARREAKLVRREAKFLELLRERDDMASEVEEQRRRLSAAERETAVCGGKLEVLEMAVRDLEEENAELKSSRQYSFTLPDLLWGEKSSEETRRLQQAFLGSVCLPGALADGAVLPTDEVGVVEIGFDPILSHRVRLRLETGEVELVAQESKASASLDKCATVANQGAHWMVEVRRYEGWMALAAPGAVEIRSGTARWRFEVVCSHFAESGVYVLRKQHIQNHCVFDRLKL